MNDLQEVICGLSNDDIADDLEPYLGNYKTDFIQTRWDVRHL